MMIRDMFEENINRQINGVIKVDQDTTEIIEQEVREYVITTELKKHFMSFFNAYGDSFDRPTDDIGVWISGFFGSGKSHFLKMLSYILENKPVGSDTTVELFRKKFADDPATFMLIDRATRGKTKTILFNIDIEGSMNKDKTAVLRVFAKMFYNHLGFFGENLKVAMLEQYIDQMGKTEDFRRAFEELKAKDLEVRAMELGSDKWIPAIHQVLVDNTQLFKGGYEIERSYYGNIEPLNHLKTKNPTGCQSFQMLSYKSFYDEDNLKKLLKKWDERKGCSLSFSSRGNPPAYSFQLFPDSLAVPVDEFIGTLISEFSKKIEGYNQFNKGKNQLLKEIAVLEKKLYKRAREPYSFWETFFGAFADLFR